ncbi:uncharacterized protein LOC118200398 isoform X2 [Stegodyphus dumicola]|uniref:uncharacterized protein LOC118200398 isoform X2 n=1 Tax=Stegodyphus dumicola TaxID=202533 RepID=UPI0015A7A7BD|nr:uncharacterized protein LOC118200398 isoform X2 [Stegodyphus dumicola]
MWSVPDLQCPAQDICEYSFQGSRGKEKFSQLVIVLTSAAELLTADHQLWTEVGSSLQKHVLINLSKTYLDLAERFLLGLQDSASVSVLPSRQQLEFVLIRTQAVSKLVLETLLYSRETFNYIMEKLRTNHDMVGLLMASSVTAKVCILIKDLLVQMFEMYQKLLPWCQRLKKGDWKWPRSLELPDDLEAWLKLNEYDILKPLSVFKENLAFLTPYLQNVAEQNVEEDDDCVIIENHDEKSTDPVIEEIVLSDDADDKVKRLTKQQKVLLHRIKQVKTLKGLKRVWRSIDKDFQMLLPEALTQKKIDKIEKLFVQLKQLLLEKQKLKCYSSRKNKCTIAVVQKAGLQFAIYLGLIKNTEGASSSEKQTENVGSSVNKLKPVYTITGLKKLCEQVNQNLPAAGRQKKRVKMENLLKSCIENNTLLKRSGDKETARDLIFCTSKIVLTLLHKL